MKKKSLDAQLKKHKITSIFLKDKKIRNIYKIFSKNLFSQINNQKFCIGVSGGPDSLALSYLSKLYAKEYKTSFKAFIVNHKIRTESKREAEKVKHLLLKQGIQAKILSWKGEVPKSNIQSKAREIRYKLITEECKKYGLNNLVMGHHADDLVENFFIRLFRGSGLKGLSSFNLLNSKKQNINKIIRPFINVSKYDLIYISKFIFGSYVVDPSNFKEKYVRTKIRNYISSFKSDGLDLDKVKLTIKNLYIANKSLDKYYNEAQLNYLRYLNKNKCLISAEIFNEDEEILFRIISDIILKIGKNDYPPRGKDLKNLILKMKLKDFNKATLGKCIIIRVKNSFIIKNEFK